MPQDPTPLSPLAVSQQLDPVIQNFALGAKTTQPMVGHRLVPGISVKRVTGKFVRYGRESMALYHTARAPRGEAREIQAGLGLGDYALKFHKAEFPIDIDQELEVITQATQLKYDRFASSRLIDVLALEAEYEKAKLVSDLSNYDANHQQTLDSTTQLSNPATPISTLYNEWAQAVRRSAGVMPNVMFMTRPAFSHMQRIEEIRTQYIHTTGAIVTDAMLADFFSIPNVVVSDTMMVPPEGGDFTELPWGNKVILAYVNPRFAEMKANTAYMQVPDANEAEPSAFYNFYREGQPSMVPAYVEEKTTTLRYGARYDYQPQVTFQGAAFLVNDAITTTA